METMKYAVLKLSVVLFLHAATAAASAVVTPNSLHLGSLIASGNFGSVLWATHNNKPCVAKHAATDSRAAEYLSVEEEINKLLDERASLYSSVEAHERYIAPYLGACVKDDRRHLVWQKAGEATLQTYLVGGDRMVLARALGVDDPLDVPRRVLHDVLEGLAHAHACGIAHRDVKPENFIVDPTSQTLRLIDFGSACDCAGWLVRRGLRPDRVPCSVLYMPPEQRIDLSRGPFAYDVYSAALIWLCAAVPALAKDEEALFNLRMELKEHRHDPHAWRDAADAPPAEGFVEVFGWKGDGDNGDAGDNGMGMSSGNDDAAWERERAWELLTRMLAYNPSERPGAAEALVGPYINRDCKEGELPMPAAEPWSLEGLAAMAGASPRRVVEADECVVM